MHERDGIRSFAYRRRHALEVPAAHVANGENADPRQLFRIERREGGIRSGSVDRSQLRPRRSAERERERVDAGLEELDLEPAIADGRPLPDQLVQPWFGEYAIAVLVYVEAVSSSWPGPVQ